MIENIVNEAMHDILESSEFDRMLDECNNTRAGLFDRAVTNEAHPLKEDLQRADESAEASQSDCVYLNKASEVYE